MNIILKVNVITNIKNLLIKKTKGQYYGNFFQIEWSNKKSGLSLYHDYLINQDLNSLRRETSDTSICFEVNNEIAYGVITLEHPSYGILLAYDDNEGERWLSIGNKQLLNIIEDVGDDMIFPIGCFIKFNEAWLVISDFFNNATVRSKHIKWINSEKINWPEL